MVRSVSIERGGSAVFDKDCGAATTRIRMITDVDIATFWESNGAIIKSVAEKLGGAVNLVLEAIILGITGCGIRATVAGSFAVVEIIGDFVGNKAGFFLKKDKEDLRINLIHLSGVINNLGGGHTGTDNLAIAKSFLSQTDKVTIVWLSSPMPFDSRLGFGKLEIIIVICVVALIFAI